MAAFYTNPLSLTSQFFFCGLPLRLDSYRGCAFQCSFCYARYRGGNTPSAAVLPADPQVLARVFDRSLKDTTRPDPGLIGQFLRRRVPIHFGGMSDPFQLAERRHRVSLAFLETLRDYQYPVVISTRFTMVAEPQYLDLIAAMAAVVVQFSFTSTRAEVSRKLEPQSPDPAELLRTMEKLASRRIPVTCRWQPYVPGSVEPIPEFVRRISDSGARHIAIEHLKLPVETGHRLMRSLQLGVGRDLRSEYIAAGASRDGREYVLPARRKLDVIREFLTSVAETDMSAGIADNEFQYLSDTDCCCSGVDQFPGFGGWFRHQVAHAVRACRGTRIVYGSIARHWVPDGSVDRWLNSRSRMRDDAEESTLKAHIRRVWNDLASPVSPARFYGVVPTREYTRSGHRILKWDSDCVAGLPSRTPPRHVVSSALPT